MEVKEIREKTEAVAVFLGVLAYTLLTAFISGTLKDLGYHPYVVYAATLTMYLLLAFVLWLCLVKRWR